MKKNVAIIAGGDSGEYEISINSASVVFRNLDKEKYNPYILIIRGGEWKYMDAQKKSHAVNKSDFSLMLAGRRINFAVVFNAIHGSPGENGKMQGYFDLLGIPYTSCNLAVSALTFNKNFCNRVVSSFGINTAKSVHLYKKNPFQTQDILSKLSLPVFVKPNNGGSSVATSRVDKPEDLQKAIAFAFTEDTEVLIEELIEGREITCGVFKYKGQIMVFPITEIISTKSFFDYEAKYTKGLAREITPAQIPEWVEIECKAVSTELYQKLNCKGVVRFDYIFNDKALYFLEVNTVPGLSEASIIPQQALQMGLSVSALFERMIEEALN